LRAQLNRLVLIGSLLMASISLPAQELALRAIRIKPFNLNLQY